MEEQKTEEKKNLSFKKSIIKIYDTQYKKLLIIPMLILVLALIQIGYQTATTGDFLNKGVSLKGGLTATIDKNLDITELHNLLSEKFPGSDISVRALSAAGEQVGVIVEASDINEKDLVNLLENTLNLNRDQYSIEVMGSSLGASFFQETFKALILAFLIMGIVVFLYFSDNLKSKIIAVCLTIVSMLIVYIGNSLFMYIISGIFIISLIYVYFRYSIPSFAVILSAFSDIVVTLAIVNMLGMRLSTSGIAAFLMLIGYSVDTDILLSTKVLKGKTGQMIEKIWDAMRTGLVMSATTIIAVIVALSFSQSDILKQMMIIVLIGLIIDMVNTWIQNAAILRWYVEKKEHKHD